MSSPSNLYPQKIDLTNCDKEPIHIIGKIQSFGVLFVMDKITQQITHYSENFATFFQQDDLVLTKASDLLSLPQLDQLFAKLKEQRSVAFEVTIFDKLCTLMAYDLDAKIVVEFEPKSSIGEILQQQQQLTNIVSELSNAKDEQQMCDKAAGLIKEFLGYDRVMVYKFDENWNGAVIAESKEDHLESWKGLNYPSTDIPQQARALFLKQGVRIIADVNDNVVSIVPKSPANNQPIDLTLSELRASSPIHIEYLQNMKVGATLTAAIVYENSLWGLIACHHYGPRFTNYYQRQSAKFLTQVFSTQLGLRSSNKNLELINSSNRVRATLVDQMSVDWDIAKGLSAHKDNLTNLTAAPGAAIIIDGEIKKIGKTPTKDELKLLHQWLVAQKGEELFYTNKLSSHYSKADQYKSVASGVLYVAINKEKGDCLLWFKPEKKETIHWGGNPEKAVLSKPGEELSPRKSFEKFIENVAGQSAPWHDYEIAAAKALKQSITEIIVKKYDEVKSLNEKLESAYKELETFSYSISHDLRAPLRGIDGFAQIIKEDYFDSLDDYGQQAIQTIIAATSKMDKLIDDILALSGLSQKQKKPQWCAMDELIQEILGYLQTEITYPDTALIVHQDLPDIFGDRPMLFQLFLNLISNAFKYSAKVKNPKVEIGSLDQEPTIYFVKDNGIGFDMVHADRIFGVFSRLQLEDYEGSGIGLAIVKRVVEKHNGSIKVQSEKEKGTTFFVSF
ncbi:ATP-binding protein [Aquimarina brevivitae]|uniref:histidine kinase n=1 Tax=Aquimarina brevivitae TaxID=323412 RepID=A0A4Q7PHH4_9FLAO|nr:ATP-binding protein [Aquimarina brevivitae]RZS99855.1 multi-sensor signal transduction histidine kinase [Aquimarina brevivitae]